MATKKKSKEEPDPTDEPTPAPPPTPPPPAPTGSEDTRTQEQKRADRAYAAARQAEFQKLLEQGATKEDLAAANFRPEKGGGQYHFSNLDLAGEFGPIGMYSGLKIDILNRAVGEPDGKGGVKWRPMTSDEYNSIVQYQSWRDRNPGMAGAYDPGYAGGGQYQGYLREQRLNQDIRAGHLTKDPKTGYSFNVGLADPSKPETWQWWDSFGRKSQMPAGFTTTAAPTPTVNKYPYDTAPWVDTPSPTSIALGTGSAWSGVNPIAGPSETVNKEEEKKTPTVTSTVNPSPTPEPKPPTQLPTWSSLTGVEPSSPTFAALTGPERKKRAY